MLVFQNRFPQLWIPGLKDRVHAPPPIHFILFYFAHMLVGSAISKNFHRHRHREYRPLSPDYVTRSWRPAARIGGQPAHQGTHAPVWAVVAAKANA